MLSALALTSVEPVVGASRDGEVHDGAAVEAPLHAHSQVAGADGRAHEKGADPGPLNGGHEHDSNVGHCSHAHGPALLGAFTFEIPATETLLTFDEPVPSPMSTPAALTHPPRA